MFLFFITFPSLIMVVFENITGAATDFTYNLQGQLLSKCVLTVNFLECNTIYLYIYHKKVLTWLIEVGIKNFRRIV